MDDKKTQTLSEEELITLVKLDILQYYDEKIKAWVKSKINASGAIDPEDLKTLKEQVAKLIKDSELEII